MPIYSYDRYTADGSASTYNITFDYLSTDHIEVYLDGVKQTSGYTFPSATQVNFTSTPSSGVVILIQRNTPKTKANFQSQIADFQDGSVLTESDLDNAVLGLLYIAQEAEDSGALNALSKDLTDQKWDGESAVIKNVLDPGSGQDVATKAYVDGLSLYNSPTALDVYPFRGTGSQTIFTMDPAPGSTDPKSFFVTIDGVLQDTDKYTIDSPNINFVTAPPAPSTDVDNIVVRNIGVQRDILKTPLLADGSNANLPLEKSTDQTSNFLECNDTDGTTNLAKINISGGGVFSALSISGTSTFGGNATVTGNVTVSGEVDAATLDGEKVEVGVWTAGTDGTKGLMGNDGSAKGVIAFSSGGPFMQNGNAFGKGQRDGTRGPYIQANPSSMTVGGKKTSGEPSPLNYLTADGFHNLAWADLQPEDIPCKKLVDLGIDAKLATDTGKWLLISTHSLDTTDAMTAVGSGFASYDEVKIVFENIRAKDSGGTSTKFNLKLLNSSSGATDSGFVLPNWGSGALDSEGYFSTASDSSGVRDIITFGAANLANSDLYNNFCFGELVIKNNQLKSDSVIASRNVAYFSYEMGSHTNEASTGSRCRQMEFTLANDTSETVQNTTVDKIAIGFSNSFTAATNNHGIVGTVKIYGFNYPTS